jgi:predicted RNase H-like HicB family nuclease
MSQTVAVPTAVTRSGNWYVARALAWDVVSQGRTEAEALARLREAVELYLCDGPLAGRPVELVPPG